MIGFKEFLEHAAAGEKRHDLFIVLDKAEQVYNMNRLGLAVQDISLTPLIKFTSGTVTVGETKARFITAHRHMIQMLEGMEFTHIYGHTELAHLDNCDEIRAKLKLRMRDVL